MFDEVDLMRPVVRLSLGAMIVAGALLPPALAAAEGLDGPALAALTQETNTRLKLVRSTVAELNIDAAPGEPVVAAVPIDGELYTLDLAPYTVRSADYRLLVQQADGSMVETAPGAVRTLRGTVLEVPGSTVAGSWLEAGLYASIALPNGRRVWVEPLAPRVPGAAANQYAIYHGDDVADTGLTCGTEGFGADAIDGLDHEPAGGGVAGGALCVAELACDADVEYYLAHGGSVSSVESQINLVINTMNAQYESQVNITHVITTIIVRTAEPDPYSKTKANQLLSQFQNEWENNQGSVVRDVAHLFTGKNLAGTTIGIAYVGAVCTSNGYSLVESDFAGTGNLACQTDLSAHELGHNWGADHCSCSSYTMNSSITCANQFHPTLSIPEIIAHRDSRTCLDNCGGQPLSCGDPNAGSCTLPNGTPYCDDAACCMTVCAVDPFCCDNQWDQQCANQAASLCGGGGDPVEAPITAGTVVRGTFISGFLEDLMASDNSYVVIDADKQGNKYRTELHVFCTSPAGSITRLDLTTEVGVNVSGVDTTISLRNDNGQWVALETYSQPVGDTVKTYLNVANPNNYVNSSTGEIAVRIFTQKSGNGGDHITSTDHVEVIVTP